MDGRVLIDIGGNPLTVTPTWSRYDELATCRCSGFDITTGRQSEFDTTDTGNATVYFSDQAGVLDDPDLVGSPIQLQVQDPTTGTWWPQWRGTIDDTAFVPNPYGIVSNVQLLCRDMFDYLAQTEMLVGVFGQTTTTGSVLYEDQRVDERIQDLLTDAGVSWGPGGMAAVFSGNVNVWDTFYDSGDSVLIALRDAADAEFPGIANLYIGRGDTSNGFAEHGVLHFHGRFARFGPDTVAASASGWIFSRWAAATREDVVSGQAQIIDFAFNRPRTRIVNAAIAWPRYAADGSAFAEADKAAQVSTDSASITRYGYRAKSPMGDLIIKNNFNNGRSGAAECKLMADFWVQNYASPRTNIQSVTFKSIDPSDVRAADTWALMLQADISDIVALTVDEAGLAAEDHYIEGFQKTVRVANEDYDMVEVIPNLTPYAYYTSNVFGLAGASAPGRVGAGGSGVAVKV